jgi:hypothetical protein
MVSASWCGARLPKRATVTRVAVWGFAIVVAVTQLGIATTLINSLVIGIIGALSLAFGLAFGLGGRDRAARMLDTMGRNIEQARPKLERAAEAARQTAQGMAHQSQSVGHQGAVGMGTGSWVNRSAADRRRVERPGLKDRREGNGAS